MFKENKNSKNKILATTLALSLAFSVPVCATSNLFKAEATGINNTATINRIQELENKLADLEAKYDEVYDKFKEASIKYWDTRYNMEYSRKDLKEDEYISLYGDEWKEYISFYTAVYDEYVDAYYAYDTASTELESINDQINTVRKELKSLRALANNAADIEETDNTINVEEANNAADIEETDNDNYILELDNTVNVEEADNASNVEMKVSGFGIVDDGIDYKLKQLNNVYIGIENMQEVLDILGDDPQNELFITATDELNELIDRSYDIKFDIILNYSDDPELIEEVKAAKEAYDNAAAILDDAVNTYNKLQEDITNIDLYTSEEDDKDKDENEDELDTSEIKITEKEFTENVKEKFMDSIIEMYGESLKTARTNYYTAKKAYLAALNAGVDYTLSKSADENSDKDISSSEDEVVSSSTSSSEDEVVSTTKGSNDNVNDLLRDWYEQYDDSEDY